MNAKETRPWPPRLPETTPTSRQRGRSASSRPSARSRLPISGLRSPAALMTSRPCHAIVLCLIYPVVGLVLARLVLGYSILPLLFPLAAGFALIGPFAAVGPYELSCRREQGLDLSASHALNVLRSPSFGAMLGLG